MTPVIHIVPILRDNYCFLIEGADKACFIVDPGQVVPVESYIKAHDLRPIMILNTHHHADHVAGNADLKMRYNIPVTGPAAESAKIPALTKGVKESDVIEEAGIHLSVMETPGHTNGHISFYCAGLSALFCGDTLFSMGCGRLIEGNAETLYNSLKKIKSLPSQTLIYCGHEYTEANGKFALSVDPQNQDIPKRMKEVSSYLSNSMPTIPVTLETEMKTNPFLRAINLRVFTELRSQKDHF